MEYYWKNKAWFFGEVKGRRAILTGKEFNHFKVRRIQKGEEVVLFSGDGSLFLCRVEKVERDGAHLLHLEKKRVSPPEYELLIGFSWHEEVRKFFSNCAYLMVKEIFAFPTQFSHPKRLSREQARSLFIEGCKRAKNPFLPQIHLLKSPDALRERADAEDVAVLHPSGEIPLRELLSKKRERILFLIGPEGGFSAGELREWKSFGWKTVKISDTVIKTEHVPVFLAGALSCLLS